MSLVATTDLNFVALISTSLQVGLSVPLLFPEELLYLVVLDHLFLFSDELEGRILLLVEGPTLNLTGEEPLMGDVLGGTLEHA